VQITTNTLTRFRAATVIGLVSLSLGMLGGCDRAATAVSPVESRSSIAASADAAFSARVVGITDGDTLTVVDEQKRQHTIRLAEIDAPERGQPWGDRAKQALSAFVFGKTISVQQTDTDRYGRVVGRLFSDGRDVNRAMVAVGAAWAFRRYLTDTSLIEVEARAKRERIGLWSMPEAQTVAPWDWRRGVRVGGTSQADLNIQPIGKACSVRQAQRRMLARPVAVQKRDARR
jgi:endonuclease YncB( thermonuclease family)